MPHPVPDHLTQFWKDLGPIRAAVDQALDARLPAEAEPPERLHAAMRYSIFAGGKRVRPIMSILACRAAGDDDDAAMSAACALECIHTYSLIHDDLPAMDDDNFRRGRPSCHKQFDEATAILAGDALLTFAFEIAADSAHAAEIVREIAVASGCAGMVGGQQADLDAEGTEPSESALRFIHRRKTGALIRAAVRCGAIAAGADAATLDALTTYAEKTGLAFQIADDILDVTATSEQLGKTAGKDAAAGKMTFPSLLGLDRSRDEAQRLAADACRAVEPLGTAAEPLRHLAEFIVARSS